MEAILSKLVRAVVEAIEAEQSGEIKTRTSHPVRYLETGDPWPFTRTKHFRRLTNEQLTAIRQREGVVWHLAAKCDLPKPPALEMSGSFVRNEIPWLDSMRQLRERSEGLLSHYATSAATSPPGPDQGEPATVAEPGNGATAAELIGLVSPEGGKVLLIAQDDTRGVEDRMRLIVTLDRQFANWPAGNWAKLLGCSEQAIRKTSYWRTELRSAK